MFKKINTDKLCEQYLEDTHALMKRILVEERSPLELAAQKLGDQIAADKLVHIYGPGGHSNLASQEIFFRAGGLMHVSAILDEGTLLSGGGSEIDGYRANPRLRQDRHRRLAIGR